MKINIYGDLCPTKSNIGLLQMRDYKTVFNCVCEIKKQADYNIVNLECALVSKLEKTNKSGPRMTAPIECLSGIIDAGFNILSVANNHSLDNGYDSFEQELERITSMGCSYVGANIKDGCCDYLIRGKGKESTAIIAVSDHEYNTDEDGYGVCVFSESSTYSRILELKKEVPYVVVIYHSGFENAVYPSPGLMKRCRAMADFGADVVLCQHSHCIGAFEKYNKSLILYGQGNFLFDLTDRLSWHCGLCVSLEITENGIVNRFVPLVVKDGCIAIDHKMENHILQEFNSRSEEILSQDFIKQKWKELLISETWKYNAMLRGGSKFDYVAGKIFEKTIPKLWLGKKRLATYLLFLRSDTHREALSNLLEMERRKY